MKLKKINSYSIVWKNHSKMSYYKRYNPILGRHESVYQPCTPIQLGPMDFQAMRLRGEWKRDKNALFMRFIMGGSSTFLAVCSWFAKPRFYFGAFVSASLVGYFIWETASAYWPKSGTKATSMVRKKHSRSMPNLTKMK